MSSRNRNNGGSDAASSSLPFAFLWLPVAPFCNTFLSFGVPFGFSPKASHTGWRGRSFAAPQVFDFFDILKMFEMFERILMCLVY